MKLIRLLGVALGLPMLAAAALFAAPAGYLFVTFKGEQSPLTEQIYFATSKDGRAWTALNGGDPVLVSQLGEKGVRDPYLLRSHDGKKFYLIATDLSINLTGGNWKRAVQAGSRSIVVWESADLVNWSLPRLVKVAPDDAGCTWAPEAVYDEENGDYLVFWASTTKRDNFGKQRIWAARTKDFVTFGEPFIFIEKPTTVIDTTIIHDGAAYYRFTKDEKFKAITMEKAARLSGPWADVPGFSLDKLTGYEGPECYLVEPAAGGKPATWCLILDYYSRGQGYQPWITHDLASGKFEPAQGFSFPFKFRHGVVLPITAEEMKRLEERWTPIAVESAAPEVKTMNVVSAADSLLLPVKNGTDLRRFDPRLKSAPGQSLSPSGPRDFSKGPLDYVLTPEKGPARTLRVSVVARNNPVIEGYYADPDILYSKKNQRFYLYPTTDGVTDWNGTSFKAFSSENLVDWKDEGVILDLGPDVSWADRRAWAPCILEKETPAGYRYYYYFCANQKIGVAVASDPAGPFKDSGRPMIAAHPPGIKGGQEIDPAVLRDPQSGKCYLYWGNQYLAVAELSDDLLSIKEDTIKILTPDRSFKEGVTVFVREGRYYFLWSEDDTRSENYRVRYATAASPLGPLEIPKDNLVIAKDPAAGIYATGHNSVIQIPGRDEWYIVYHRFVYPKGLAMGREAGYHREVCIDKMEFAADGSIRRVTPTHQGIAPVELR